MNSSNSLSYMKWNCEYHIVFASDYRGKVAYGKFKDDIRDIIKMLCQRNSVNIIMREVCPDYIHLLVEILPQI